MKKSFFRLLSVGALLLLLFRPSMAFGAPETGLVLWGSVVVPSLLPFMILFQHYCGLKCHPHRLFSCQAALRFFCLSDAEATPLSPAFSADTPWGPRTCSEFMDKNRITSRGGRYLLAICNHHSPCSSWRLCCVRNAKAHSGLAPSHFHISAHISHFPGSQRLLRHQGTGTLCL